MSASRAEKLAGPIDSAPRLFGGLLLAAAAAAALLARDDLRAASATRALAVAGSAGAPEARRAMALQEADAALASGAPTAELRDLAASRALLGDRPDLDQAETLTWGALQRSPARPGSWARLAYIDIARDGALGPDGVAALERSYEAEPFAAEALRHWRIEFTLSRWREIPPELRAATLQEAKGSVRGARWYEETIWLNQLVDRLPPDASAALKDAIAPAES
jgi:hypothetical protein